MQTVTFQCGHCGKLMGVSSANLGQQVRCPHCQKVVLAPAQTEPAAPPPPPPAPTPVPVPVSLEQTQAFTLDEKDSIFTTSSVTEQLELPAPLPAPEPLIPEPTDLPASAPLPSGLSDTAFMVPDANPDSTLAYLSPSVEVAAPQVTTVMNQEPALPADILAQHDENLLAGMAEAPQPRARRAQAPGPVAGASLGFWILILSLISYSVLATVFVVILLLRQNLAGPTNLLRELPDVDGDNPGGQRKKVSWKVDEKINKMPIPADQRVGLKQTIQVGDVEITPIKVERRTLRIHVENFREPEPSKGPSLVLHLRLANRSRDFCFAPLDSYFDRNYNPRSGDSSPLTCLEIGTSTFYGGPAKWVPRDRDPNKRLRREWIESRTNIDARLDPGKSIETFVCTDGDDEKVLQALADSKDSLLWRVHLRRGLVRVDGRDVPATAIIGVPFSPRDIVEADATP